MRMNHSRRMKRLLRSYASARGRRQVRAYLSEYGKLRKMSMQAVSHGNWPHMSRMKRAVAIIICMTVVLHLVLHHLSACRIGEAMNPGPASVMGDMASDDGQDAPYMTLRATTRDHGGEYFNRALRRRARIGEPTRHVRCPGVASAGDARQHTSGHDRQDFALSVVTLNGTSWGSCQLYLQKTTAHVVLLQEHHLAPNELAQASRWLHARGWKAIFIPAEAGKGCGTVGGTAILARSFLGLAPPLAGGSEVIPARGAAGLVTVPGCRPLTCYSLYLKDGAGMGKVNAEYIAKLGEHVNMQPQHAMSLVGGDMQMAPDTLLASGLPDGLHMQVMAADTPLGTCRSTRSRSNIDYFLASHALVRAVKDIDTEENMGIKPHVPVRLSFHPCITSMRALKIRHPPMIPKAPMIGPRLPPPGWDEALRMAEDLVHTARHGNLHEAEDALTRMYAKWAQLAEDELIKATGAHIPKRGCRTYGPDIVWRSIVPEQTPVAPEVGALMGWRALATTLTDLKRIATAYSLGPSGGSHAEIGQQLDACGRILATHCFASSPQDAPPDGTDILLRLTNLHERLAAAIGPDDAGRPRGEEDEPLPEMDDWHELAQTMATELDMKQREAAAQHSSTSIKGWRDWILENFDRGAKNAHKYSKLLDEIKPAQARGADGVVVSDPLKLLQHYVDKFAAVWRPGDRQTHYEWDTREALPRPTVDQLRRASASFPANTAMAYDGFHPKHFGLMTDKCLQVLAAMMEAAELVGSLPRQLHLVTVPLLAKPKGGHRPIMIYTGFYRMWSRVRKPYAEQWETANRRAYYAAAKARSAQDAVWRQAVRAETGITEGKQAATVLWDLSMFYEHIDRQRLDARVRRTSFPLPIFRLAMAAYAAPRMLCMTDALSAPLYPTVGIGAGCVFANVLTKVYTIQAFDEYVATLHPTTVLDTYVDDLCLSISARPETLVDDLAKAAAALEVVIEADLACVIALDKAAIVASTNQLARALARRLGDRAGELHEAPPNLGIDFGAGKKRKYHGPRAIRKVRLRRAAARRMRLRRIRKVVGNRAKKIFTTGVLPDAAWGAAVNGLDDGEAHRLRQVAAVAVGPKARGRSLHMTMLVAGVPTWRAEVAPLLQLAREVWRAASGQARPGDMRLPDLAAAWRSIEPKNLVRDSGNTTRRKWTDVRGPMGAAWLTLHRLAWSWTSPFVLHDDRGIEVSLIRNSPATIAKMLHAAVARQLERGVAAKWAVRRPEFQGRRICVEHILPLLNGGKSMSRWLQGIARSVICGAAWTFSRAADRGYDVPDVCPLCGAAGDTVFHRVWRCPCTKEARSATAPEWLRKEAARADPNNVFWTTGVCPHPADTWPLPSDNMDAIIDAGDLVEGETDIVFDSKVFIDGSCTVLPIAELRRAGAAVIARTADGVTKARARMALPRELLQSAQTSEHAAYAMSVQLLNGVASLYGDCASVVRDASRPVAEVLSRAGAHAGYFRATLAFPNQRRMVKEVVKVKAHQNTSAMPEGEQRYLAEGNDAADIAAKEATRLHPQPSREQQDELDYVLKRAPLIVKTMAAAMACFPPMPTAMSKRQGDGRRCGRGRQCEADEQRHHWVYGAGKWRCGKCARMTRAPELTAAHRSQRCNGPKPSLSVRDMAARGHSIMAADTTPPVAYCVRCGAFSVRRARLLNGACAGAPTPNGKVALDRIARGLHPWDHGVGRRSRGVSTSFAAWDAGRDAWIPSGGAGESGEAMDEAQTEVSAGREPAGDATCIHDPRGAPACPATAASDDAGVPRQRDEARQDQSLDRSSHDGWRGKRKADCIGAASDHAPSLAARRRRTSHDTGVAGGYMHIETCPPQGTLPRSMPPTASTQLDGEDEKACITVSSRNALLRHLRATPGQCGGAAATSDENMGAPGGGESLIHASRHGDMSVSSDRLHVPSGDTSPRAMTGSQRLPAPTTRAELLRRLAGAS